VALLPTLGTFFIISAGPNAWLNQKLLASQVMVWIGLISYPLYLWHWPLLSFLMIQEGEPSRVERIGAVFIAIVLSWLTYRFIEKPFRFGGNPRIKAFILLITLLIIFLAGILIVKSKIPVKIDYSNDGRSEYLAYLKIPLRMEIFQNN